MISEVKREKGGSTLVTTESVGADGTRTPYMVQRVSATGMFLVAELGTDYVAPWCLLKLPHKDGQTWETDSRYSWQKAPVPGKMTAGPVEKVKVPAGEFTAARVEWERNERTYTYWYANGVGLVRLGEDMLLTSFTPGKN